MKERIDFNHFLINCVADVYAEIPEDGKVILTNCSVTIDDDKMAVVQNRRVRRNRNQRIFKAGGVSVMTRPDGTYVLTAEIDPTESGECAKTKRHIASGIKKALIHHEQEGGLDEK